LKFGRNSLVKETLRNDNEIKKVKFSKKKQKKLKAFKSTQNNTCCCTTNNEIFPFLKQIPILFHQPLSQLEVPYNATKSNFLNSKTPAPHMGQFWSNVN
jgi:hypothetical protein